MTLARYAALAVAGAALTACISTEPIPTRDYGFVVLVGEPTGTGEYFAVNPIAYFIRSGRIAIGEQGVTRDSCSTAFLPATTDPQPGLPYLDAGSAVTVVTPVAVASLDRVGTTLQHLYYKETGNVAYTPGGSIDVSVPGADGQFPEMSASGLAASTFTFSPVPVADVPAADIALSWTAPPAADVGRTTMNVSLRYAEDGTTLNRQIFCTLVDDGSYTVDKLIAEGWHTSQNDLRETLFERVRISIEDAEETESTLAIISTYLQREATPAP